MTLPAGVVIPPTQPAVQPPAAPTMPTPTVLPPSMPAVTAPAHDMTYQPPPAPASAPTPAVAPPPATMQPAGSVVLNDPSLPPELQGQPISVVLDYYNKLRTFYMERNAPAAPTAPAPTTTPAPTPTPAPSPAPSMPTAADFWADPVAAMDRVLQARMAPVTQTALQQQVIAARNTMMQAPGYEALEPQVLAKLNGIPVEQLTNPELWKQAYYLAYGEAAAAGWQPNAQSATPAAAPATPAAPTTPPAVNTNPRPFAPTTFFTEPARPNAGPAAALTPEQQAMAAKMRMSHEEYMQWMPKAGGAQ